MEWKIKLSTNTSGTCCIGKVERYTHRGIVQTTTCTDSIDSFFSQLKNLCVAEQSEESELNNTQNQ